MTQPSQPTRTCPCGNEFEVSGKWSPKRYCSAACSHLARVSGGAKGVARRAALAGKAKQRRCAWCGAEFIGWPTSKYCTPKCSKEATRGNVSDSDDSGAPYLPTPEEIAEATAKIRETWSEAEMRTRLGLKREVQPLETEVVTERFYPG